MKQWMFRHMVMAVPLLLGACAGSESVTKADASIEQFHERLNAENYDAILNDADPLLFTGTTRQQWLNFLTTLHARTGDVATTRLTGTLSDYSSASGSLLRVRMASSFQHAKGDEEFVFKSSGNQLKLVAYHIKWVNSTSD